MLKTLLLLTLASCNTPKDPENNSNLKKANPKVNFKSEFGKADYAISNLDTKLLKEALEKDPNILSQSYLEDPYEGRTLLMTLLY